MILFSSSGAAPDDPETEANYEKNLPEDVRVNLSCFPMGGRIVFSELKPLYRFMMNLGMKMEKDPEKRREIGRDKDNMDREFIRPLVASLT